MSKLKDAAMQLNSQMIIDAQDQFIKFVMAEEDVSYYEALAICEGRTDPVEICYTVGFKLSNPTLQKAMSKKKTRENAIKTFESALSADELQYYRAEILPQDPDGSKWNEAYHAKKSEARKSKMNN